MAEKDQLTPAMRQYHEIKRQVGEAILFFRMGDFYEMFYEDALTASRALELTLTARQKDASGGGGIPMCGVPYHAAETYIARLIRRGFKVAVCDQMEDPREAKGIVRREVVRVVTPSTYVSQSYLEEKEPSYLMTIAPGAEQVGASMVDLSTGDWFVTEYEGADRGERLKDLLGTYRPRELLLPVEATLPRELANGLLAEEGVVATTREGWRFEYERARAALTEHFRTVSLDGFGCEGRRWAVSAAGAALQYLRETQGERLSHLSGLRFREEADHLILDSVTQRNLELIRSADGGREGTLLAHLDRTSTAMGGRLLRQWLLRPLIDVTAMDNRLDAVENLAFDSILRSKLGGLLAGCLDIERVTSRVVLGTAGPRDVGGLAAALALLPKLTLLLEDTRAPLLKELSGLDRLEDVRSDVESTLSDEPPPAVKDGGVIRRGVSPALDELRQMRSAGAATLVGIETRERERTGISSLKVRYNKVFGYYIEVTKAHLGSVPEDYVRKQTLVGAERFITEELKTYEEKVLSAEERILAIETELFEALRDRLAAKAARIRATAQAVATVDAVAALAEVAATYNYVKPRLHEGFELSIEQGRHPVIEALLPDPFVPNDLLLDENHHLIILTGPNMGGKSTYLRQTALIVVMAQMGSFVPAAAAKLPVADRIFTRVGASDQLARGRSTFMVEMQETAHILRHASSRSLILLDEIGRGTATFDGLSLAWAVAEHIATDHRLRSKTIFATHYHELTELGASLPGLANYHVSAKEWKDEIVFLRKVVPGGSDRSYGIQVAQLAGIPVSVIHRAQEILGNLERGEFDGDGRPRLAAGAGAPPDPGERQLSLFANPGDRVAAEIRNLDPDRLTPLEALQILIDLKRRLDS